MVYTPDYKRKDEERVIEEVRKDREMISLKVQADTIPQERRQIK